MTSTMRQRRFNRPIMNGRVIDAQPSLEEVMSTREALREMADAYPCRFTDQVSYAQCRAELEGSLLNSGWPTAKIQAEVDDAIVHRLIREVAGILRR